MDFLWGLWSGITAWPLLVLRAFGALGQYPIYDVARDGGWYRCDGRCSECTRTVWPMPSL